MSQTIAVLKGDGIGPEIMEATLRVLSALDCGLRRLIYPQGPQEGADNQSASTLKGAGRDF